jgi:hypothetical protein
MATYELWNVESGNLLGTFPDEAAALAAVVDAVSLNGVPYGELLALGRESARGNSKIVASGKDLVERARQRGSVTATTTSLRRRTPVG